MRAHLDQKHRYEHVVRVARCAELLAGKHGLNTSKARLAGMLHDLARLYPANRLLAECELRQMTIDAFERQNPIVLHARLGAHIAEEAFSVHDAEVLSAIEKHTVGAAAMSPLDCVLYLADGLEPGRSFPEREHLWKLAQDDLGRAMLATIRSTMRYLETRGLTPAPQTAAAAAAFLRSIRGGYNIAELIDVVRDAALDKKGEDFTVIDVAGRTILADAFALVTGRSKVQTRAIADAIAEGVKASGGTVTRMEGYSEGTWILIDLGHVIAHVFTPDQRAFYNLERLWSALEARQAQGS